MKIMVIYDSLFGNTEKIAYSITDSLVPSGNVRTFRVSHIRPDQLIGLDLLIVGSPTRAFRPTIEITGFLNKIPSTGLKGIKVVAFDTRLSNGADKKAVFTNIFTRQFGYASKPIADKLVEKGGILVVSSKGFVVKDIEGPLKAGEIERAADWAKTIVEKIKVPNE